MAFSEAAAGGVITHDKGYYHSYCRGDGRAEREPFGHTSYLSRSTGGVCRNAMVVHSQLARVP